MKRLKINLIGTSGTKDASFLIPVSTAMHSRGFLSPQQAELGSIRLKKAWIGLLRLFRGDIRTRRRAVSVGV